MDAEKLFEELKGFVYRQWESADLLANTAEEVLDARKLAFGAVFFFSTLDLVPHEEIEAFWDKYMWEKFNESAKNRKDQPKVEII